MAGPMPETPPPEDREPESADAEWLVRDDPREPAAPVATGQSPPAPGESYDILGGDADLAAGPEVEPPPLVPPIPAEPRLRPKAEVEAPSRVGSAPTATVDHVWTRWGEWGPDLLRIAAAGIVIAYLLYLAIAALNFSVAFLILLVGGAALLVLSYPIITTLERPVRVTPEQAVRDYYTALSHHLPHYRRMWLLLSSAGRSSPAFSSFSEFRAYWQRRIAEIGRRPEGWLNPLTFEVDDFRSEKSAGLTAIKATFTVNVFARGPRHAGPIESVREEVGLVKGPDRMWYLNRGTLPGGASPPERPSASRVDG